VETLLSFFGETPNFEQKHLFRKIQNFFLQNNKIT